jgi:hypothetical protein
MAASPADLYWVAVLSAPGTLLAAGLQVALNRSRARRRKTQKPAFMWRWAVFLVLVVMNSTFIFLFINQSASWKQHHRLAQVVPLLIAGCMTVWLLESGRYTRRMKEQLTSAAVADAPPAPQAGRPSG